ncbi:hypothetical protein C1X93_17245 [Pseudomonas sp. GW456-11-11-14-LB1]|nr:hypothetical protein C1Y09_23950 [Pseudomonas sp. FW306-02-F08-AA]PNA14480.1 hypothetical protein C1X93_17245 [Pseudomonas sp. GW456-11-11-14-LB1]
MLDSQGKLQHTHIICGEGACPNADHLSRILNLWRGGLLPLGREAALKMGTATQSSGSKLPHHRVFARLENYVIIRGFNPT